jgi:uncharacterized protein (DUF885 family)
VSERTGEIQGMGEIQARLDRLADRYWDAHLETQTLAATALGDPRFDDRMPDNSPAGTAGARSRLADILRDLDALGAEGFTGESAVTRDALRETVTCDLAALDSGLHEWNVDPLDGVPAGLLGIPDYHRVATPDDGRRMVARWRAMASFTDQHRASLERSLADGRVACRAPVERTVGILDGLLAEPSGAWPLLAPLGRLDGLQGWTTADRARFGDGLRSAVDDEVRPALARLRDTLAYRILTAARPTDRPGMGDVPGGAAGYRGLVRLHTSLDLDPEQIHRTGLDEIARIDAEMEALAGRTLGTLTRADALVALRADPSLHFATRDEVADAAAGSLARAVEAIPDWFGRLPQARCEVMRMGLHEEAHNTIAYYRQPAADGSRPGRYYINTGEPQTRPRYEAQALAYHEAVPGHHLQIAIGQELPHLPAFRRHLGPTAFFEGWGLYAERLADEMGLYGGDLDRIGVLSFDAWRAARLVVDTGMHALGWSRDRAVAFMLEHTALAPNNIANEVDRYIVMPGQALAYKLGQLELLRLRAGARDRLGAAFDIRAFHDAALGSGALALPALRGVVAAWVDRTAAGSPS